LRPLYHIQVGARLHRLWSMSAEVQGSNPAHDKDLPVIKARLRWSRTERSVHTVLLNYILLRYIRYKL
jgi:hypothetical protein